MSPKTTRRIENRGVRGLASLLAAGILLAGLPATVGRADDSVLFSTFVQPNVLLMLDNSGSMAHIIWHPDYDPAVVPTCTDFDDDATYYYNNDSTETHCGGNSRRIYHDNASGANTRWDGRYLNWYFGDASAAAVAEMAAGSNGFPSSCVGGSAFAKYQRSRLTSAKQAIKDIVCEVNQLTRVRFGLGVYRNWTEGDPNGGYVIEEIAEYNSTQAADLDSTLQSIRANSWTPLGESLFQAYTFFMSRTAADRPFGKDGITRFPGYEYNTSTSGVGGTHTINSTLIPADPVEFSCQKNFVIIITDGEPTMDDFDVNTPTDTALGFSNFVDDLIGDFNADGEVEEQPNLVCNSCYSGLYLDDIAKFMHEVDFRLDFDGDQTLDVYTVGFATGAVADALLQKTADVSNGIFFHANDATTLAAAIIDAFSDIIAKAQSFTAATVPATRTAAGESLYVTQFIPSEDNPFWLGQLKAFEITGAGEIRDALGNCALDDPTPGECFGGSLIVGAPPFWEAGDEVPAPALRDLYTTHLVAGVPTRVSFDSANMTASDLGIATFPPSTTYPGSTALNAEGLTDEIVENVRGCNLGTGVTDASLVSAPTACVERPWLLSDIFHSNPKVVGSPSFFLSEPSYSVFSANHVLRDRIIYAGANDGFLRGFNAGDWDAALNPARHDRGTGVEQFGIMPWPARQNIRHLPTDTGGRDYYFVDGSPQAADVWRYSSATQATKAPDGSEWSTVLLTGMREGGEAWMALDVSDPAAASYPEYLWEFPTENDSSVIKSYIGETWADPIITKIRVKVGADDNNGEGYERWVAIVTGGYDPSGDPNVPVTYDATNGTKGRAIVILDVKTGRPLAAKYFQPAAPVGDPQRDMVYAIPSTPGVYDLDFDGYADVIYVGDLGGRVWKWVIHEIADDRVNDGSGSLTQPSWTFRQFFEAPLWQENGSSPYHHKSFFFPPAATLQNGVLWLALGSGERENLTFEGVANQDGDNNRFYVLNDSDVLEQAIPAQVLPLDETNLLDVTSTSACSDVNAYRGFYFIGAESEKFVTRPDVFLYYVFVASYVPSPATDPCELGGEAFLYVFRISCGEGFFDDGNGNVDREISLGPGMPTDPRITVGTEGDSSHRVIINQQGGEILSFEAPPGFQGSGMFYWRELFE